MSSNFLEEITQMTCKGEHKLIRQLVRKALRQKITPHKIIQALSNGVINASKEFKDKGMFLDNIVLAVGAFEIGTQLLPLNTEVSEKPEDRIVLGVMGGPWTIGKSIVAANLRAHGFNVIDAGADISPEKITKTVFDSKARIIASAIYLTHSAEEVAKLEEQLSKIGIRHKIRTIISGPAASKKLAESLNVDAYAKDVLEVIAKAKEFAAELKTEMTPYDRVMTSLKHKEPDRVPVMPFAQTFSAKFAGIPYSVYCSKAEAIAEGQVNAFNVFGWDGLCFSTDVGLCAEACGAKVKIPYDDVPRIIEPVLKHESMYRDFKNLDMPDLLKAGRLTENIKGIEIAKKKVGDEVPVIGWTEGPFQGVALLAGAEPKQIFYIMDHPDEFKEILDWYVDFEVDMARAMYEAGADIIGMGETGAYFMSPQFFERFVLEPEKKACKRINKLGLPVLIHCCGYVPQCLHFVTEINPGGAIQFDYQVDLAWAKKLIGDKVTIMGNLNYNTLINASSKQMYEDCAEHIKIAGQGGGYWLAFGCEIPRNMPPENIRTMIRAAKTVGKYPIKE